jgi:integrase/recombinase XerD
LPVEHWPDIDRAKWLAAQTPAGFLEEDKPASHWSPARRRIVEHAYGQWLAFLNRSGLLDSSSTPGDRATEARLRDFVAGLQARISSASVLMMTGGLVRMLAVLAPEGDWTALARTYRHLKRTAVPSRDKAAHMVAATELFNLGIRLMQTWAEGPPQRVYKAARYRDGLVIAMLAACPIRVKNLAGLVIGQHLVFDGRAYRLEITAAETKTGRPYIAAVPDELTPYVDRWLQVHRPVLPLRANAIAQVAGNHLWLDRWGRPMSSRAIRRQIERYTEQAFGKPIWPHLFRHCAVTELVDFAPDEIAFAPDLLGHADLETTQKYYIQAQGMTAHRLIQEVIAARRRAALERRRPGA